jgi:hypothetical protein
MRHTRSFVISLAVSALVVFVFLLGAASDASAQLNTQHIKGITGLKAGSQPPPHLYLIAPLVYLYNTDTVKNRNGDKLPVNADITVAAWGLGASHVTTRKVLGGEYGYTVLFAAMNNRLQGTEIDADPGGGISDTAFTPMTLGWHFKRADVLTGFTMYLPTGRYSDGADDNTGLGMWGWEPQLGATLYLNEAKAYHASTLMTITAQSKKEDSDTKVGTTLNLEGGLGADFLKGGLTTGLVYYAAFKLAEDRIEGLPGILIRGKNKVFALGPEVSLALARRGMLYGFLRANYQWETYARTTTQGSEFMLMATFLIKPIKLPGS